MKYKLTDNTEVKVAKHKPKFFGKADIGDEDWINWIFMPFMLMLVTILWLC